MTATDLIQSLPMPQKPLGSWQPILNGALAEQARTAVQAIAASLAHSPLCCDRIGITYPTLREGASLAGGSAGLALFYSYWNQAYPNQAAAELALHCLENAFDAVAIAPLGASLYSGFTGVAWATAHLRGRLLDPAGDEIDSSIDAALLALLAQSPWQLDYDLIVGLTGMGVYALERLPHPLAIICLERIVDHLEETSVTQPTGYTWWTNPAWLPAEAREQHPLGYYNLGLAHGVPGVIAFLGATCAAGVAVAKARPLLNGAVAWLLAQRMPAHTDASFTYWLAPGKTPERSRLAWCYGDPGVAIALLAAARTVDEPAWAQAAIDITLRTLKRPPEQAGIFDAGLCHGSAGLAHIYNRFYQATGEPRFAAAAQFWFAYTLDLRRPDVGIAGYQAWAPGENGELTWLDDPGLLTGAAGIGLALLAATTDIEPAWDRMLLVDAPLVMQKGRALCA
ncbi:MAG: lanthionine synthetase C family protein [Caldilineaceae bacterium]